jgi:hypothetical protein
VSSWWFSFLFKVGESGQTYSSPARVRAQQLARHARACREYLIKPDPETGHERGNRIRLTRCKIPGFAVEFFLPDAAIRHELAYDLIAQPKPNLGIVDTAVESEFPDMLVLGFNSSRGSRISRCVKKVRTRVRREITIALTPFRRTMLLPPVSPRRYARKHGNESRRARRIYLP